MRTYETAPPRTTAPARSRSWHATRPGGARQVDDVARDRGAILRGLFDGARDGIGIVDPSMRVVVWNDAAWEITGAAPWEVLGAACEIDGNRLTLDGGNLPSGLHRAAAADTGVSLCDNVRVKTKTALRALPNVVATVIPVGGDAVGFLLHLGRRASPGANVPAPAARPPAPRRGAGSGRTADITSLTPRERQILALLTSGRTAKPISSELSLSLPTVRTHIQHILRKLGVHSCLEAVTCFLRDHLPPTRGTPAVNELPLSARLPAQ